MMNSIIEILEKKRLRYEQYANVNMIDDEVHLSYLNRAKGIEEAIKIIKEYM